MNSQLFQICLVIFKTTKCVVFVKDFSESFEVIMLVFYYFTVDITSVDKSQLVMEYFPFNMTLHLVLSNLEKFLCL